ncbi:putative lipid II flippase FtsW [Desulfovibrio mangrovi]|uniref:putative lipid II flippase FtsW n=1 Tax=Desulfovibrio mangrovi TaxID=2976983 RepID=UPI002245163B|nr:putative lipid II flippase FtsW [Desulfovibrio mangrovi]UZP67295.1 putative lipid II flippase FtsW [Desulfovibrio mangrovi]
MAPLKKNAMNLDWVLLASAVCLVAFGLTMVLSASGIMAEKFHADKYYFFKRQLMFAGIGGIGMLVAASIPRKLLNQLQYPALGLAFVLTVITLTPLGTTINGSSRWISFGIFAVQPMEFARIALVLYLAYFFSAKQELVKTFSKGVIPPFAVTGLLCLLLLKQPDFGGAAVMAILLFFMCLVGGTRLIYLAASAMLAGGAGWLLIMRSGYRSRRLLAFLDPFKDAQDSGYQLVQSLFAMGSGGITGQGLGASKQKLFFLPEPHNDFIMAVVGEELGFVGVSLFFIIMGVFLWRAFRVAYRQEDLRDRLTAFGLALILMLSAVFNLAVVMGAAPPKGVAMPFMSYGGSSLVATFLCVGLLLNFSRTSEGTA